MIEFEISREMRLARLRFGTSDGTSLQEFAEPAAWPACRFDSVSETETDVCMRQAEGASGAAAAPVSCPACTYDNLPGAAICEICGSSISPEGGLASP